ncbi:helix-turn-helix domain-containing protein [Xanthobacter autotrophicus]|uniref:Helix-turn-helix domain-containing protein n=1 Tax=Xanthobacter autotrophicus TaxID=280 RepID=A0A6C1KTP0_XANAU|nr:helix-turn-helix domain-containing protein [Xanthobacter autotrophicus]
MARRVLEDGKVRRASQPLRPRRARRAGGMMSKLLTVDQAAAQIGVCPRTLLELTRRGEIAYISVGLGRVRQRRLYHPDDIAAFVARRRSIDQCPSTSAGTARSTITTSSSKVVAFSALLAAERSQKLNSMRKTDETKPGR